jgi:hypothetical protein
MEADTCGIILPSQQSSREFNAFTAINHCKLTTKMSGVYFPFQVDMQNGRTWKASKKTYASIKVFYILEYAYFLNVFFVSLHTSLNLDFHYYCTFKALLQS